MKEVYRVFSLLISALISLLALYKFNIFDYILIIPTSYHYEVGIMVYFAFFEIIIEQILNRVKYHFCSQIDMTFYSKNVDPNIKTTAAVSFNECDIAEIFIEIAIDGTKKQFESISIKIPRQAFATMQVDKKDGSAKIDSDGNCVIYLEKLLGNNEKRVTVKNNFKLSFIREPVENSLSTTIDPIIIDPRKKIIRVFNGYHHNSLKLRSKEGQ